MLATPDKAGTASPWIIAPLVGLSRLVTAGERPGWLPGAVGHLAA